MTENEKKEKVTKEKKETKEPKIAVKVEETVKEAEVKVEVENIDTVEEKDKNKTIVNIIAIALIALTLVLGIYLVVKKPSPKYAAKDYFDLSIKNPLEAIVKYAISEFDVEVEKEKGKYTTYKIESIGEIEKENGKEIVKVFYVKKGPNSYKIEQEVVEILEKREIKADSEKYNSEFLKEIKLLLKQKKDQLEETKDVLILIREKGERNWTISSDPFL